MISRGSDKKEHKRFGIEIEKKHLIIKHKNVYKRNSRPFWYKRLYPLLTSKKKKNNE